MPNDDCAMSSYPSGARIAASSRNLPALLLARTAFTNLRASRPARPDSGCSRERLRLKGKQLAQTGGREVQQRVELVTAEGVSLGRALNLDERAAVVHDDVHVGFRARVFRVIEVEH